MGRFRFAFSLCFKARLSAKRPRFEKAARKWPIRQIFRLAILTVGDIRQKINLNVMSQDTSPKFRAISFPEPANTLVSGDHASISLAQTQRIAGSEKDFDVRPELALMQTAELPIERQPPVKAVSICFIWVLSSAWY